MIKITTGDRVLITNDNYRGKTIGHHGTVHAVYHTYESVKVGVRLDDMQNGRSTHDCFYYDLKQLQKECSVMNNSMKLDGNYRIAIIHFIEGTNTDKGYEYACYDDTIEVNDKCVVKSAHHGLGIGTVTAFVDNQGQDIYREIVGKVDFSNYEKRLENRLRKAELIKQMKKRSAELQEITLFETLAKADTEMAKLLEDYKNI